MCKSLFSQIPSTGMVKCKCGTAELTMDQYMSFGKWVAYAYCHIFLYEVFVTITQFFVALNTIQSKTVQL